MDNKVILQEIETIRNTPIVFILGKGRSGTTLLQAMLNAHPNIVAPPESKFAMLLFSHFGHKRQWTKADVTSAVEALYTEFFFAKVWKPDKEKLTSKLLSCIEYLDYQLFCKLVYCQMQGDKKELLYISDKNPIYPLFIDHLLEIFPDAKFIHLVRDPRDTVLSNMKTFGLINTMFVAQQWLMDNRFIEQQKQGMPERFFTVFYEKMVENPEYLLKKLCEFLKVPYSISMQSINAEATRNAYEGYKELFDKALKNILNPVNTDNTEKWKKEMEKKDISKTEAITGEYADSNYGYKPSMGKRKVAVFKIACVKAIYYCWLPITRVRFTDYKLNKIYSNIRKAILGNRIPPWENTV